MQPTRKISALAFLLVPSLLIGQNYKWGSRIGNNGEDGGEAIAVDAAGNSYVTGRFSLTVDFDPGAGTTNLTSAGAYDIFYAKYDASGNLVWAKSIGSTTDEEGTCIAVDGSGNVYIGGYYKATVDFDPSGSTANLTCAGVDDIFCAKYDASGNFVWANGFGAAGDEDCKSIAVDGSGNVHIVGAFENTVDFDPGAGTTNLVSNGSKDVFVAKYDGNGNLTWAFKVGSTNSDVCYKVKVDGSSSVFITGVYSGTADFDPSGGIANLNQIGSGGTDIFMAKYSSAGAYQWAKKIGDTGGDIGFSLDLDGSGNIYLVGSFFGTVDFDPSGGTANLTTAASDDIFFAKYDGTGAYQWAKGVGANLSDEAWDVAVDGSGNVYVTGYFSNTVDFDPSGATKNLVASGGFDQFYAKYDNNGAYQWAASINASSADQGNGIDIINCDVYILATFNGTCDLDPGAPTVSATSVASTADFVLINLNCFILPVDLLFFNASCQQGLVRLDWATASELNNDRFVVERSNNLQDWQEAGQIKGSGTSSMPHQYSFTDYGIEEPLYYRLKQVDFNGDSEYFSPVRSNCEAGSLSATYDPVSRMLSVISRSVKNASLTIMDAFGKIVFSRAVEKDKLFSMLFPDSFFSSGIYFISVQPEYGRPIARKVAIY